MDHVHDHRLEQRSRVTQEESVHFLIAWERERGARALSLVCSPFTNRPPGVATGGKVLLRFALGRPGAPQPAIQPSTGVWTLAPGPPEPGNPASQPRALPEGCSTVLPQRKELFSLSVNTSFQLS